MMKKILFVLIGLAVCGIGFYLYKSYRENAIYNNPGFVSGNGRLEATEVNIAAKLAGKIESIQVREGDYVKKGDILAKMQTNVLEANLAQAKAKHEQAITSEASAQAMIKVREAELDAAKAAVEEKKTVCDNSLRRFKRSEELVKTGAQAQQEYENNRTLYLSARSDLVSAEASVKQAEAALNASKADAAGAKANILAALADIDSVQADIDDSTLAAPLEGRIQYRIAEPGEVLSAGGRVLNLVDLTDVYMTFYLPEEIAGKVKIGADVRLLMDALPQIPIPAKVTFVSPVAQFTPKTVETREERQKLMFRVKAHIDPELLRKYIDHVKTGVPGVAWVRIDDNAEWPDFLKQKKPENEKK